MMNTIGTLIYNIIHSITLDLTLRNKGTPLSCSLEAYNVKIQANYLKQLFH